MAATHPLHTEWKNLKNKHDALLKQLKLKFDKGLGPQLDTMASKPGTKAAGSAALKAHQYAMDYAGNKYLGGVKLDEKIKKDFVGVLEKIKTECKKTPPGK